MKLPFNAKILAVLIPAFLAYFYSESVLRQGAVSSIDPKRVNVDSIINELPGSIKEAIGNKLQHDALQDQIRRAKTPGEKAAAISNLADFTKDQDKRSKIYADVLKNYPNEPETLRAYCFFLHRKDTPDSVSIRQFLNYINKLSFADRFYAISMGYSTLKKLNASDKDCYEFLKPLLDIRPQFRDYSALYRILADLCSRLGYSENYRAAIKYEELCLDMPLIELVYMEEREKDNQARNDKNGKGK